MSAPVAAPPRRPHPSGAQAPAAPPAPPGRSQDVLLLPVAALVIAACLSLTRVFVGIGFLRPVLAAALLSLGVSWVSRRLGAGPLTTLVSSALAWAVFVALAFLPSTLAYGVVPRLETLEAGRDLWLRGIELIRTRPSPAFPEPGMLYITATGVWWVAHAIDGLVFRLQAPLRATAMALVLWAVPLAMARDPATAWVWAAPLLAAAAWLLLRAGSTDLRRWGTSVRGGATSRGPDPVTRSGALIAGAAIAAGALLAGFLPGFGEPPYYRVQNLGGGTTITTNPIVSIRANLVTQSPAPVARVRTSQPVYLRLTALDVFDDREQWTGDGIRGGPASGRLPFETELRSYRELEVEVTAEGLGEAILVPVPYQPLRLSGPAASRFSYDPASATVTVGAGHGLAQGDSYTVRAAIPDPDPAALAAAPVGAADPAFTALPANVPEEVVALAERIVTDAGADNPFEQALAIQRELQGWDYSLDPPPGHGSSAMRAFIENRVGYCEQFAGTMAVMLRSLGIPTRVAVGFTPGEVAVDDGDAKTYLVTHANAHAWVEVLFPGAGWIAFEPTPRDDGNVLTPSATTLAPTTLDAEQDPSEPPGEIGAEDPDALVPDIEDVPLNGAGADAGTAGDADAGGFPWRWIAALAAVAGLAAVLGGRRVARQGRHERRTSADRVLAATERVRRTGRGLGVAARPWETDREYLCRLAARAAPDHLPPARGLADAAARARYATAVSAAETTVAEADARRLLEGLVADVPVWRRPLVRVQGTIGDGIARARARLRGTAAAPEDTRARVDRLIRERAGR